MNHFRLTVLIGGATSLTRVLGFLRDVLLAALLGAGPVADAFFVALRIPNLVRRLMGEGGWTGAYVPIATRIMNEKDGSREHALVRDSLFYVSLLTIIAIILSEVFALEIIRILAPGLSQDRFDLAVLYFRALAPLIFGVTLTSLLSAILISQKRFTLQAIVPVFVNAALVLLLIYFNAFSSSNYSTVGLILSIAASGVAFFQVIVLLVPIGIRIDKSVFERRSFTYDFKSMLLLAAPNFIIQFGAQFGILILFNRASENPGAISYLTYAERLAQLPFGFIASGLATIALPEFASRLIKNDRQALHRSIDRVMFLSLALALPATISLVILAEPIISVLFERGAFGHADRIETAAALSGFVMGLPFAAMARVQTQLYFAYERVRIPLVSALLSSALIWILVQMSFFSQNPYGFAAAFSIGQAFVWLFQQAGIKRLSGWGLQHDFKVKIFKILFATGLLAVALLLAKNTMLPLLISDREAHLRWGGLALLCIGGFGLYALMMHFLGLLRDFR